MYGKKVFKVKKLKKRDFINYFMLNIILWNINWGLISFLNSKVANFMTSMINPTLHFKVGNFRTLPYKLVEEDNSQKLINKYL